jgi:hypothetical protein
MVDCGVGFCVVVDFENRDQRCCLVYLVIFHSDLKVEC